MDIILTTNSPGEVSAWVKPMVKALKKEWPHSRITVFIPPCTFASGQEVQVVERFAEVEKVVGPRGYITYAILRKKPGEFNPGKAGFILFLGGDLNHAILLGKRLSYPVFVYSDRAVSLSNKIVRFFVPTSDVAARLRRKGVGPEKIKIVGDLMCDAVQPDQTKDEMYHLLKIDNEDRIINLFPGSRPFELKEVLPLFLKTTNLLMEREESHGFKPMITLAPFINLDYLIKILKERNGFKLEFDDIKSGVFTLKVNGQIYIVHQGNSYNTMQISDLVLALPGTNNVELATLGVPALIVLPLNWPELIPLPGLVGMVGQIPHFGKWLKKRLVIPRLITKFSLVSPINRNAKQEIFPELVGLLTPDLIAERLTKLIVDELPLIRARLQMINQQSKASEQIVTEIQDLLVNYFH